VPTDPLPRRRRRLLHIARRYVPMVGGIERYVLDVAVTQARRGDDVRVATLRRDVLGVIDADLDEREVIDGVAVTRLPGIGNQRSAVCLRPDRLALAIRSSDAVHLHDLRFMVGFVALVARLTGRPLLFHTHGLLAHTTFASRLKRILLRGYYGPMLRLGRAVVIASSDHDREMLLADVPALGPRTITLQNAVDLRRYLAIDRQPDPARLLVIGRVAERKGIDRLLRALAVVTRRAGSTSATLVIAGTEDADERTRLDALVLELGLGDVVTFHGGFTEEEQAKLLSTTGTAIFPSRAEGFGLALLEAMASAIPVLASDIPPHRALLEATAPDALVDFDDAEAAADRIEAVLTRPAAASTVVGARLRDAARPYGIDRLVDEIEAVYATIDDAVRPGERR
jgi:glycosyltransferase involved in cell wall biosynthesis